MPSQAILAFYLTFLPLIVPHPLHTLDTWLNINSGFLHSLAVSRSHYSLKSSHILFSITPRSLSRGKCSPTHFAVSSICTCRRLSASTNRKEPRDKPVMSEIRLETFLLRSSVLAFLLRGSRWTSHWGIRINGQLYEVRVRKSSLWPCPFTFGTVQTMQERREAVTSTYLGWTHFTEDELEVIGIPCRYTSHIH